MARFIRSVGILTLALATIGLCAAQGTDQPQQAATSSLQTFWDWPVLRFVASLFDLTVAPPPMANETSAVAAPDQPITPCSVAPLDPITDPAALQLEAATDASGTVDISDMVPAAALALDRFESKVAAVGGTIVLKSAYRPAAYQKHLQDVWYKWMDELRINQDPACQPLRSEVQEEFTRHRLIETQHPVAVSDHTRGLAFDATVSLPTNARIARRRLTLDGLARLAGLLRPAIAADPVHFKFVGAIRQASRRRMHSA